MKKLISRLVKPHFEQLRCCGWKCSKQRFYHFIYVLTVFKDILQVKGCRRTKIEKVAQFFYNFMNYIKFVYLLSIQKSSLNKTNRKLVLKTENQAHEKSDDYQT